MMTNLLLVLATFLLALLGWFKSDRSRRSRTLAFVLLTTLVAIFGVRQVREDNREKLRTTQIGILKPTSSAPREAQDRGLTTWQLGFDYNDSTGPTFHWEAGKSITDCINMHETIAPFFRGLDDLSLEIDPDHDRLLVSLTVRNSDGNVVAALRKNEWTVNRPAMALDRNYSQNTLEVIDHQGRVVLQVRLLPDRAQVNGIFYGPDGNGVAILPPRPLRPGDDSWIGSAYVMLGKENPPPIDTIEALFVYPSHSHLGEFRAN